MRTLTKSGIRELMAKYRSILKKCAILNAIVLTFGITPSLAENVANWSELQTAVSSPAVSNVTITKDIGIDSGDVPSGPIGDLAGTNRYLGINGQGFTIDAQGHEQGITLEKGDVLNLHNVSMQNFTPLSDGKGGAINNEGSVSVIVDSGIAKLDDMYNDGILYIKANGTDNVTKSVLELQDVSGNKGRTEIDGGTVLVEKGISQNYLFLSSDSVLTSTSGHSLQVISGLENNGVIDWMGCNIFQGTNNKNTGTINAGAIQLGGYNDYSSFFNQGMINITTLDMRKNADFWNFGHMDVSMIQDLQYDYKNAILRNGIGASLTVKEDLKINEIHNAGSIHLLSNAVASTVNHPVRHLKFSGSLNLTNNSIGILYITRLGIIKTETAGGTANLMIDADLAGSGKIDQLNVSEVDLSETGTLNISDIHILSDGQPGPLPLFTGVVPSNVTGHLTGLSGPVFIYNADYANGQITFTQTGVHPYLYVPSTMAQTTANITGQIAGLAMDKLHASVGSGEKGLAGGDMSKANNAWVKVMGFDDDVDFKGFNNSIDSKAYTLAAGFNTDKVKFDNFDAAFGIYGGYIGGRQKYTGSKIEQDGGYIGLSSELTKGNAFLLSTVNAGFINNEAENMYGTDKFDTRWFGIGLKGGYNYALTNSVVFQPNFYAGYTFVNTEDYTSKSGVKVDTDNLNFFEIDPGFKLSAQIEKGWLGFIQGKYAIVMDNGGKTKANEIALPNISNKNYVEYGFGMSKILTDIWSLNGEINRRDGGRTGWNGSVEFKYNF